MHFQIYEKNDFHFLEVNDVQEEDKGTYSITISNHLGSESMSAELEVFGNFLTLFTIKLSWSLR